MTFKNGVTEQKPIFDTGSPVTRKPAHKGKIKSKIILPIMGEK